MSLVKWAFIALLLLPAAEVLAFVLVAAAIGWFPAAALSIATSILGALLLKRSARADFDRLRAALAHEGLRGMHLNTPGAASMVGGILLVFPGFITDLIGGMLLVPTLRRWLGRKLAGAAQARRRDDHVIDLEPGEWHQIPDQRRRRRRKPEQP
jgi:UPF0716 protein FxsA